MTTTRVRHRPARALVLLAAGVLLAACDAGSRPKNETRLTTDDFVIRVSVDTLPVRALDHIHFRVVIHDRKTGKPVQGGEGRIFATNRDRKSIANGLEETGELGTYRTNLMFVTAGMWAMGVQFRSVKDTTVALQKTLDWTQDVLSADEPGNISTPVSAPRPDPDSARIADSLRKVDSLARAASKPGKVPPPVKP